MLDLDSFKIFNDRFGHTSGDAALRKFGAAMKSALRKSDAAFRYGGDEFTIILPATEAKKSRHIIERIRAKWLQAQYNQFPNAEITIDFSVGIAQYPDDTETIDGLIFLADTALLIAKREGGYKSTLVSELGQLPPDVLGTTTLDQVYKLAATVDAKSLYAEGHSRRVAIVAETIGKYMGLDEEQLSQLRVAALLHDIGKIAVPDLIMGKPYGLSKDEKRVVEKHPSEGAKILSHIRELAAIVPVVRHHHEWYNGAGYPDRIKGEDIPFLARILTVADSYDTMTTPLPHKKAMTHEEASEELRRYSGIQFDPEIVEEFCRSVSADEIRRET
jgi:diguanylate cyclase (GGDEF)-like protein/putative nucleotidyltransferase with HDIG domain